MGYALKRARQVSKPLSIGAFYEKKEDYGMKCTRIDGKRFDSPPRFVFDLRSSSSGEYREPVFEMMGIPDDVSTGMTRIPVRSGLSLTVTCYETTTAFRMGMEADEAPASFCFRLEGSPHHSYKTSPVGKTEISGKPGDCIISRMRCSKGYIVVPPYTSQLSVSLQIDPDLLALWLEEEEIQLQRDFQGLISSGSYGGCLASHRMSTRTKAIALQIALTALKGEGSRLFFEAKALELLTFEIQDLSFLRGNTCLFSREHRERLFAARDVLLSDLQNPPTIPTLARTVGMNEFRLKKDFKIQFGAPIHATLTRIRMESAWRAIAEEGMGVSEAAWHVGYTNVSHFIAVFRNRYGVRPGSLLAKQRNSHVSDLLQD